MNSPTCWANWPPNRRAAGFRSCKASRPTSLLRCANLPNRSVASHAIRVSSCRTAIRKATNRCVRAIAARMSARGAGAIAPNNVIVLTGSTQGIAIVAQSLAEPGDEIIVESPSYPGALQVFQINGLRAIAVPVDEEGMRVDHVEAILRTRRPRFIYTMPSLHNPTSVTMNADRRERLTTIARRASIYHRRRRSIRAAGCGRHAAAGRARARSRRLPLDVFKDHRTQFARRLAGIPAYDSGTLLLRKQAYDMATSLYVQAAVTDYLDSGYDAHVEQLREELLRRRKLADEAIAEHWPAALKAGGPAGGFYLWATTPREVRARALLDAAERLGASFLFGEAFFANSGGDHQFRLALTAVKRRDIAEGIRRIGEAAASLRP